MCPPTMLAIMWVHLFMHKSWNEVNNMDACSHVIGTLLEKKYTKIEPQNNFLCHPDLEWVICSFMLTSKATPQLKIEDGKAYPAWES